MPAQPWEPRVARLEGVYEQLDTRLESIDRQLEMLDREIDGLTCRMTSLTVGPWLTLMLAISFHKT